MLRKAGLFGVALMSVVMLFPREGARAAGEKKMDAAQVAQHALKFLTHAARESAEDAKVPAESAFGQQVQRGMVNVSYPITIFHAGRGQHERWFTRGALMANLIYLSETSKQNHYLKTVAVGTLVALKENVTATGGNIEHVVGGPEAARHLDAALGCLDAGHGSDAAEEVAAAAHALQSGAFYSWYYLAGFTIASLQWDARLHHDKAIRAAAHSLKELLDRAPKAGAGDDVTASVEVHPGMHPSLRRLLNLVSQDKLNYADIVQEATTIQSYAVT